MSKYNMIRHDMINGVFRWRYIASAGLFLLPAIHFCDILTYRNEAGTWMDFLFYAFKGMEPITNPDTFEQVQLPMSWILIFGGCLFLNMEYLLNDLSNAGQQVIVRCNSRKVWYLSKCLWNITSCVVYFLIGMATTLIVAMIAGAEVSLADSPTITFDLYSLTEPVALAVANTICVGVILPLLTLVTLSLLQMMLSLFLKPILSFMICISLLVIGIYTDSSYAIGCGAMVVRSRLLTDGGVDPVVAGAVCIVVLAVSVVLGVIRFKHTDILGMVE